MPQNASWLACVFCTCYNFACRHFLLCLLFAALERVVCRSCTPFSLQGGKRESNPASFVSFVEEEDEKTSQPEKRDCEEKVGVREVKAYLEERGEGRRGRGGCESVSSPVCQLENSWCLLQTPFLSPQRKDR